MKKSLTLVCAALFSFNTFAGMVVIGNNASIDSLNKAEVKNLFMGKKTKLANDNSAIIVELINGAEGKRAFHDIATGRSDRQLKSAWTRVVFTGKAKAPLKVADYSEMLKTVADTPNAIGYVDESAVTADVKILLKL